MQGDAYNTQAFSLLELMVVIAIIAILATIAIPSQTGRVTQKKVIEALELVEPFKDRIEAFYHLSLGNFPEDNDAAGMPEPGKILGNYIEKVEVRDGVMHLFLGQKMPANLHHKIISVRPVYVKDSPDSPISWVCGHAAVPDGMTGAGRNLTDVGRLFLPGRCRV